MLALPALPKAPKPPLQDPAPLAVALMLTAVVPHAVYGPPAFAVAAGFTVMVVWQLLLQPGATKRHASFDALQLEEFRPGTTTATVPVAFSMPMVPGAMLLMDVNDFKEINDTLGHKAGDYVLREIGLVARSVLRPYDVCARFGGDEFVLVLWDCDRAQAERRRQQLEDLIGAIEVTAPDSAPMRASASIGIAVYPMDGRTTDQLLAAADDKMYERKASLKAMRRSRGIGPEVAER